MAIRSGTGGAWQSVPVEPGSTYLLGHHTRSDRNGAWARLQVNFLGESGETIDVAIKLVPATRTWSWHELTMTAPEKATIAAIYAHTHEHAEVWFDDLCFVPLFESEPGNE
jgi:hypothetical protein